MAHGIELDVARAKRRRTGRVGAPCQSVQAGDQLGKGEGLVHVVVGPEREAVHHLLETGRGGEHEHAAVAVLVAQGAADVVAVQQRQVTVENQHVVGVEAGLVESFGTVVGDVDRHSLTPKAARNRIGHPAFVLRHEHAHLDSE